MKVLSVAVWIVAVVWGVSIAFHMISASNTVENIIGFFLLVIIGLVSYNTKCFLSFKFKRRK